MAGPSGVRPEIQALRAIAVALVVLYHYWHSTVRGGFVGVDVFFAISGFLITSLLLREIDRTGALSLSRFWARRARRILPAALVALLACAAATVAFVPITYWQQFFADMRASTAYVQNWHLAAQAVDYFAASNAPSPVQHYWSLSVEEQFYLAWPMLIVLALAATRKRTPRARRYAIGVVMGALLTASLVVSLRLTASNPGAAYFVTTTRAWEFAAGGLLALAGRSRAPVALRAALSWAGLAAIAVAGLLYSAHTPVPGAAAILPIAGTLAVIHAGAPRCRWAPTPLLGLRPLQFLGDISYSVYLWHWPLIILAPFALHHGVDTPTTFVILMLTILCAWLSKVLVEDPIRSGSFLVRRRLRWTFAFAAAATAFVLAVDAGGLSYVQAQVHKDAVMTEHVLAAKPACFGAAVRDPNAPCRNAKLKKLVIPSPLQAPKLKNAPCLTSRLEGPIRVCGFGSQAAQPKGTIALVGDSHASHWRAALQVVARRETWRGVSLTHTSCPFSAATPDIPQPGRSDCVRWRRALPGWLARHPSITTVFVVAHTGGGLVTTKGKSLFEAQVDGYLAAWKRLPASVQHVVVIRDTPKMHGDTLGCVERAVQRHVEAGPACAVPRRTALETDPEVIAQQRLHSTRIHSVDLSRFVCGPRQCWPVVGGALVFKDVSHLTAVFAVTLAPYLQRDVDTLFGHTA